MDIQVLKRWRKRLKRHGTPIRLSSGEKRLAIKEGVVIVHYEPDALVLSGAASVRFFACNGVVVFLDSAGPLLGGWVGGRELIYFRSMRPKHQPPATHRLSLNWDLKSRNRWLVTWKGADMSVRFKCLVKGGDYCTGVIFFL